MRTLLIDDIRNLSADRIARNYEEGIKALQEETWDLLLLDHDLADFVEDGSSIVIADWNEKTGYDVMCWLEENLEHLPKSIQFVTANPVGRQRMMKLKEKLYEKNSNVR